MDSGLSEHDAVDQLFQMLPLEVTEMLLMRTYTSLVDKTFKTLRHVVNTPDETAYSTLASVCFYWWQTLRGWPESDTRHWLRHRLQRIVAMLCGPYCRRSQPIKELDMTFDVHGIAQLDDKLFAVGQESRDIDVYDLDCERVTSISVPGMRAPCDIVACRQTRSLFVVDRGAKHNYDRLAQVQSRVWRVTLGGPAMPSGSLRPSVACLVTMAQLPCSLSLRSRRLLLTTMCDILFLIDADTGGHLLRLSMPRKDVQHAVETSRGTFIVCHWRPKPQVSEMNADGHVIRAYDDQRQLARPRYLSVDWTGMVLVADINKHQVLLLSKALMFCRVVIQTKHNPHRFCYVQHKGTRRLVVCRQLVNFRPLTRIQVFQC